MNNENKSTIISSIAANISKVETEYSNSYFVDEFAKNFASYNENLEKLQKKEIEFANLFKKELLKHFAFSKRDAKVGDIIFITVNVTNARAGHYYKVSRIMEGDRLMLTSNGEDGYVDTYNRRYYEVFKPISDFKFEIGDMVAIDDKRNIHESSCVKLVREYCPEFSANCIYGAMPDFIDKTIFKVRQQNKVEENVVCFIQNTKTLQIFAVNQNGLKFVDWKRRNYIVKNRENNT